MDRFNQPAGEYTATQSRFIPEEALIPQPVRADQLLMMVMLGKMDNIHAKAMVDGVIYEAIVGIRPIEGFEAEVDITINGQTYTTYADLSRHTFDLASIVINGTNVYLSIDEPVLLQPNIEN